MAAQQELEEERDRMAQDHYVALQRAEQIGRKREREVLRRSHRNSSVKWPAGGLPTYEGPKLYAALPPSGSQHTDSSLQLQYRGQQHPYQAPHLVPSAAPFYIVPPPVIAPREPRTVIPPAVYDDCE